jgi:catechol 2,3-dioxygenase-like lactoylglutathione lyase family enzyme
MAFEIRGMAPLLQVFDMPASLTFYRDKLGFRVTGDSGKSDESGWVMLERDGVTIMLNTAYDDGERPDTPDHSRFRAHHDTCIYFGCPDVDAAYDYLKSQGIEVDPPSVAPYGMKQLYLTDPDNYNLCFQWPHESDER